MQFACHSISEIYREEMINDLNPLCWSEVNWLCIWLIYLTKPPGGALTVFDLDPRRKHWAATHCHGNQRNERKGCKLKRTKTALITLLFEEVNALARCVKRNMETETGNDRCVFSTLVSQSTVRNQNAPQG